MIRSERGHRNLASEHGWLVVAATGLAYILLLLVTDLFLGGSALLDVMMVWP